jgi:hypothetical protein
MRRGGVAWAMLVLGGEFACGGRYEHNPHDFEPEAIAGSAASAGNGASGTNGTAAGATSTPEGGTKAVAGSAGMPSSCVEQTAVYDDYRSQVMTEFQDFPCMADSDCRSYYFQSQCDPSCMLLTTAAHRGIVDRLNTFASFNCNPECWPQPWVTCPPVAAVHCIANLCQ